MVTASAFELLKGLLQPAVLRPSRLQRWLPTSGSLHELQLRALAQVIFINNPASGLVLLLAFLIQSPATALLALLGSAAANGTAWAFGMEQRLSREGIYGFNGALVGCSVAHFAQLDPPLAGFAWSGLVLLGGALSSLLMEGLGRSLNRRTGLPPLTLSFCLITWALLVLGSLAAGSALALAAPAAPAAVAGVAQALALGLPRSFGQVFLLSNLGSGLLVVLAVALASPLAAGLGLLGALVAMAIAMFSGAPLAALAAGLWGYNGVLVAIALGGIFYAPTAGSLAIGLGGAALASLLQLGWISSPLQAWPSLTLAFILATWAFQLLIRRALPALIPVSLHAILTPEEHRQRFVLARTVLADFRRNLSQSLSGQRRAPLAGQVPALMRQKIAVLFERLDQNGNGALSAAELLAGLNLDPKAPGDRGALAIQLTEVLQAMDFDGDGRLNLEEFAELMLRLQRLQLGEGRLLSYLMPVDTNGNDRLDPAELRRLLTSVGEAPLSPAEEQQVFGQPLRGLSWRQFVDRLLLT